MRDRGATYLLLAPAALIFGTLFVLPLIYFLVISFWRVRLFKLSPDFTFVNYLQVFDLHLPTLIFTLSLAFLIAVLTTALGFTYAYLIRFKAGRWGPTLLFIALITLFGGYLMKIYSWMTILGITGVLNTALRALGIIEEPLPWLFYNVGAVVVTLVNFLLPLAVLPIYASMRGITDIEMDAAGDYLTPQLVGGKVNMIGVQIAPQFGGLGNWPMGAAMSFVTLGSSLAVIVFALYLLSQWRPR